MSYIGNTTQNQNYVPAVDYFNGDGSTVAFTLSRPVASVAAVQAVISNVPQNPGSAFTVSGSTITFTSAPPSGTANIYVYYTSPNTQVVQPGQGTVYPASLSTGGPYWNTAGNVGFGTSSPAAKVDIVGATSEQLRLSSSETNATTKEAKILVRHYTNAQNNFLALYPYSTSTDNAIYYGGGSSAQTAATLHVWMTAADNTTASGTERMRIDSAGRVTMPYQTMVIAALSSGNVTGDATVVWNSVSLNVGSAYNASTGVFTCPIAGNYLVYAQSCSVGTTTLGIQVRYNGTVWSRVQSTNNLGASSYQSYSMSSILHCAANDTIDIRVPASNSIYGADTNYANMYITLLG